MTNNNWTSPTIINDVKVYRQPLFSLFDDEKPNEFVGTWDMAVFIPSDVPDDLVDLINKYKE